MPSPAHLAKAGIAGLFAVVALATPAVIDHEGWLLRTYRDPVGIPTVGAGVTGKGVIPGKTYTQAEAEAMTAEALLKHALDIRPCLPASIPVETHAAFVSLAYNIGASRFCSSTLSRKARAGDLRGACDELPRWNKAGGKVLPGLVKRRAAERRLCLEGIAG